jgi:hypothetical protein
MRYSVIFFFLFFSFGVAAQEVFQNKKGGYKISVPERWTVEQEDEITSVYAPDEEEMDSWKEKLEISLTDANDLTLEDAFNFYTQDDLPNMYKGFKIIRQGEEVISGLNTKWVLFSFSGSGTVGTAEVSFTFYNLFYLTLKNNKLFMLNGIAEKEYYQKLESDYLKIVRSFQITK